MKIQYNFYQLNILNSILYKLEFYKKYLSLTFIYINPEIYQVKIFKWSFLS